jgi:hypothetical protein
MALNKKGPPCINGRPLARGKQKAHNAQCTVRHTANLDGDHDPVKAVKTGPDRDNQPARQMSSKTRHESDYVSILEADFFVGILVAVFWNDRRLHHD